MFNLFRSQGKATKYLLTGLLALVAMSMLLYLVPNYGGDSTEGNTGVLIKVGNRKITSEEIRLQFLASQAGKLEGAQRLAYFPRFLDQTTQIYALREKARQLGFDTTTDEIIETLVQQGQLGQYFENGKLVRRDEFTQAISATGLTPDAFFQEIRDDLTMKKVQNALAETAVVTPAEVESAFRGKYERLSVDYIAFAPLEMRKNVTVSDADVQKKYEETKAGYQQPEKYSYRVVVLPRAAIEAKISIPEADLRAAYTRVMNENFRVEETIHARHILFDTKGKSDDEKKKLKQKADDLVKQLKGGADFAALAKANSQDTGNADRGGDLGTFSRGSMVKAFDDAAFALKPKEISDVVTSEFGYHIIQVLEKTPAKVRPFDEVRADIEKAMREEKLDQSVETTLNQLHADLKKDPANAASIAQKYGAELVNVPEALPNTPVPSLGVTPEIDAVLHSLQPGTVSDNLGLPGDRTAVVLYDKKIPGRPSTFEEVKNQVRDGLIGERAVKMTEDRGKEAAERLKKGEDIRAVAKALGVNVQTASTFGLTDNIPDLGPAVYFQDAFKKGAGTIIGPTLMSGQNVVAKAVSKTEADMSLLAAERPQITNKLRSERAQLNDKFWMDAVVRDMTNRGDLKVNQDELKNLIARLK